MRNSTINNIHTYIHISIFITAPSLSLSIRRKCQILCNKLEIHICTYTIKLNLKKWKVRNHRGNKQTNKQMHWGKTWNLPHISDDWYQIGVRTPTHFEQDLAATKSEIIWTAAFIPKADYTAVRRGTETGQSTCLRHNVIRRTSYINICRVQLFYLWKCYYSYIHTYIKVQAL